MTERSASAFERRRIPLWAPGALALLIAGSLVLPQACVQSSSSLHGSDASATSGSNGAGPSSGPGSTAFDKRALLAHLGQEVILGVYTDFLAAAATLEAAAATHAATLAPSDRDALEVAWREAMAIWQKAEVLQIGPAGTIDKTAGGVDLRNEIYSWPLVNRCRTDQKIVSGEYASATAIASDLINVRGLDALEYLIFNASPDNACSPQNSMNTQGSWAAIAGELEQRRADYVATLGKLLHDRALALLAAWEAGQGNFVGELASAGNGSTVYATDHAALNALSDALFYLDIVTKDVKLAVPAGLSDCAEVVCPEALESTYAGFSKEEVRNNLLGFAAAFHGGARDDAQALGFDDWLVAVGAGDLATRMGDDIAAALTAVDAIEEDDLADALMSDRSSVEGLYFAVKAITDNLKSQFITVLDLEIPKSAEGDDD